MERELTDLSAIELADRVRRRALSATEVMAAYYDRIERDNPALNALVNVIPREAALSLAAESSGEGPLAGLPMAPKDLEAAEGFPTTFGFPPLANATAAADSVMVQRLRKAGAVIIGKSNTPEFGLGSQTFNRLFGATRNPWDAGKTPGGSSGGAAAAVAGRLLPLADGSDMGGSLRNPAAFCNLVGFRPSIGRIPEERALGWLGRLATKGPIARTVADAALLFAVQCGYDPIDPLSLPDDLALAWPRLADALGGTARRGLRIAWSADLGGLPIDGAVRAVLKEAPAVFTALGCEVQEALPDLSAAMEIFQVQRAAGLLALARNLDKTVPDWRDHAKDTMLWNVQQGANLTAEDIVRTETRRSNLYRDTVRFFERFDALICPTTQVPPFDVETEWVDRIEGQPLATYLDWMSSCCMLSVTGLPCVSVPAGFTADGLPVGLQIVGPPHGDASLLALAHAFEQATPHHLRAPA